MARCGTFGGIKYISPGPIALVSSPMVKRRVRSARFHLAREGDHEVEFLRIPPFPRKRALSSLRAGFLTDNLEQR